MDMNQPPTPLQMGDLTRLSEVSSRTVRYYERLGLIKPIGRTRGGYRIFQHSVVERIRFIRLAQGFGLSLEAIRSLLKAEEKGDPSCIDVRRHVEQKMIELAELLRRTQEQIAHMRVLDETCDLCTGPCSLAHVVATFSQQAERPEG